MHKETISYTFNQLYGFLFGIFISFGTVFNSPFTHLYPIVLITLYLMIYTIDFRKVETLPILYFVMVLFSYLVFFFYYLGSNVGAIYTSTQKGVWLTFFLILQISLIKDFTWVVKGILIGLTINIVYGLIQFFGFDNLIPFIPQKNGIEGGRITLLYIEPSAAASYLIILQLFFFQVWCTKSNLFITKYFNSMSLLVFILMLMVGSKGGVFILALFLLFTYMKLRSFIYLPFFILALYSIYTIFPELGVFEQFEVLISLVKNVDSIRDVFLSGNNSVVVRGLSIFEGINNLPNFIFGVSAMNMSYAYETAFSHSNVVFVSKELDGYITTLSVPSFKSYLINNYYYYGPLFIVYLYTTLKGIKISSKKTFIFTLLLAMTTLELFNYLLWISLFYFYSQQNYQQFNKD